MQKVASYLEQNADKFVEDLKGLLRIPSVSADSAYQKEVRKAADYVKSQLEAAGLKAELHETKGNPIVFGSWLGAEGQPTALVYGHYDVQPPDPLNEWITPPFEPDIRDGMIYARGATDDKGQMLTHIKSAEAWMQAEGKLPINIQRYEPIRSGAACDHVWTPRELRLRSDGARTQAGSAQRDVRRRGHQPRQCPGPHAGGHPR
jgi:acetylornithine deacetylase/succinyl-diaminopimelate desuccinylase-like protein